MSLSLPARGSGDFPIYGSARADAWAAPLLSARQSSADRWQMRLQATARGNRKIACGTRIQTANAICGRDPALYRSNMSVPAPRSRAPLRILTAVPLCDGHDSAITTINLELAH